ncbi:MAG: hypothetical protein ABI411_13935 [Tahibacter sp.]
MSTQVYVLTLALFFGTILMVFWMKYFSAASAVRARIASDDAYRSLAEQAVAAQSENQASLSAIRAELSSVATRVAAVEKILKQVE